jgi:hypothetical protein
MRRYLLKDAQQHDGGRLTEERWILWREHRDARLLAVRVALSSRPAEIAAALLPPWVFR